MKARSTLISCIVLMTLALGCALIVDSSKSPAVVSMVIAIAFIQYRLLSEWNKTLKDAEVETEVLLKSVGSKKSIQRNDFAGSLKEVRHVVSETIKQQRAIVEQAADVICLIDVQGRILSVNPASAKVFGFAPEELMGKLVTEFLIEEKEGALTPFLGAEKSIEKIFIENRLRKKGGEIIDLLWSAHWSVSDGALYCIAHDITERKRAEQLLRASEKRVRLILENVPAGIAVLDAKGYFEFMNTEALQVSMYEDDEIGNLFAGEVFPFCERPFEIGAFAESAKDATDLLSKPGERIPCQLSVSEFTWNESPAVLVIFLDLRQKYAVEQAKRQFVAMVSHDLRGPLGSISTALTYLGQTYASNLDEKGRNLFLRTANESLRLVSLINDLLDLEKMKSGRFVSLLAPTNVLELAKRSAEVVELQAEAQGVTVEIEGNDCRSDCDGARIIQVLVNLLDNAIRYSQPGQAVKIKVETGAGSSCIVSVSNHGRLIPSEKLKTIFESFEQVSPGSAKDSKGTGLGLAICKSIIEQHGQSIRVESSEQKGTVFTFSLPPASEAAVEQL